MSRYRSEREAVNCRIEACRLAATVLADGSRDDSKERLWATCVFFESYIAHGAGKTRKWMDIETAKAPVFRLVPRA